MDLRSQQEHALNSWRQTSNKWSAYPKQPSLMWQPMHLNRLNSKTKHKKPKALSQSIKLERKTTLVNHPFSSNQQPRHSTTTHSKQSTKRTSGRKLHLQRSSSLAFRFHSCEQYHQLQKVAAKWNDATKWYGAQIIQVDEDKVGYYLSIERRLCKMTNIFIPGHLVAVF